MDTVLGMMAWGQRRTVRPARAERVEARRDTGDPELKQGPVPCVGKGNPGNLVPSQFDPSLSSREAYAACGPAAAVAFARAAGRNLSLREVLDVAKTVGWTPEGGMNGVFNQKRLLDRMGIRAKLDTSGDWNRITKLASNGTPVTISTPGHYFVADAYDPQTGRFHVGASGTSYRSGKEWMTREEMERLAGPLNGALVVDNKREWIA